MLFSSSKSSDSPEWPPQSMFLRFYVSAMPLPFRFCRRTLRFLAATKVFRMSMVTVIGPTPPGTGVMCPATFRTSGKIKKRKENEKMVLVNGEIGFVNVKKR